MTRARILHYSIGFIAFCALPFTAYAEAVPSVTTLLPEEVTEYSAVLRGTVTPHGQGTRVWVEHGIAADVLGRITNLPLPSEPEETYDIKVSLSGLTSGSSYYYKIVAENGLGKREGLVIPFKTAGTAPSGGGNQYDGNVGTVTAAGNEEDAAGSSSDSCLSISLYADDVRVKPGQGLEYGIAYRNECDYVFKDAALTFLLPGETDFAGTNYAEYVRDAGVITYRIGDIAPHFQSVITIQAEVAENEFESIIPSARLSANGPRGETIFTAASIQIVPEEKNGTIIAAENFAAKIAAGTSGIIRTIWFWLIVAPLMIFGAGYFVFGRNGNGRKERMENTMVTVVPNVPGVSEQERVSSHVSIAPDNHSAYPVRNPLSPPHYTTPGMAILERRNPDISTEFFPEEKEENYFPNM